MILSRLLPSYGMYLKRSYTDQHFAVKSLSYDSDILRIKYTGGVPEIMPWSAPVKQMILEPSQQLAMLPVSFPMMRER